MEFTSGYARLHEVCVPFATLEIDPLGGPTVDPDGSWYCGVDGDLAKLKPGKMTITNMPQAVRMVAPSTPKPNPAWLKPRNKPASKKALVSSNTHFGGTDTEVDNGSCWFCGCFCSRE